MPAAPHQVDALEEVYAAAAAEEAEADYGLGSDPETYSDLAADAGCVVGGAVRSYRGGLRDDVSEAEDHPYAADADDWDMLDFGDNDDEDDGYETEPQQQPRRVVPRGRQQSGSRQQQQSKKGTLDDLTAALYAFEAATAAEDAANQQQQQPGAATGGGKQRAATAVGLAQQQPEVIELLSDSDDN
jgi:hypothetical protein